MDMSLSWDVQLVVSRNPLRVVRGEHMRLDPELREMRGQLQGTSDPAAARGREVHRHEEHPHRAQTLLGRASATTEYEVDPCPGVQARPGPGALRDHTTRSG